VVHDGGKEANEVQEGTGGANDSCSRPFYNRVIDGCPHRAQHGCRRGDIGISAAHPFGGKALLVRDGAAKMMQSSLILSV